MLAKCANPDCATPLRYLRGGKVFELVLDAAGNMCPPGLHLVAGQKPVRIERFWLCADCAAAMTLTYQPGIGINVMPSASPNSGLQHSAIGIQPLDSLAEC